MQLHVSRSAPPIPKVQANGRLVPFVSSIQLLGIRLQILLRRDTHINGVIIKANSKRYFLLVLKHAGISAPDLVKFYTAYVRPTLEYTTCMWHASISDALYDKPEGVQWSSLKDYLSRPVLRTSPPTHRTGHSAGQTCQSVQDI